MNRTLLKKIIISALVVVVIGGGGFIVYNNFFKAKATTSSRYITEQATVGTLNVTISGTGTVSSSSTKDVVFANSGKLSGASVSNGTVVTQGQTLGTVSDDTLQNQINTDQAKLSQAKQQLSTTQLQKTSTLEKDQETLNVANQQLSNDTNKNADSLTITKDQNAINDAQNAITNDTNTQNNNIAAQTSAVQQAQNSLNTDLSTQKNETLTAPISGTIENLSSGNGDTVQSGKTLATIMDLTHLQLQVPVDELDISKVKVGQKADISFDDVKDKKYTGTVASVPDTGTTSNNITTYAVVVTIDDSTGLKLGMNANVTIDVQSKNNALMVPTEAITTRNGKKYVMEPSSSSSSSNSGRSWSGSNSSSGSNGGYNRSNSGSSSSSSSSGFRNNSSSNSKMAGKLVEVQTGISNQDYVEIISGISEGQKLLVQLPNLATSSSSGRSGNSNSGFGGSGFGGGSGSFGGNSGFGGSNGSSKSGN